MKADLSYNCIVAFVHLSSCFHNCSHFREIRNYLTNGTNFEQTCVEFWRENNPKRTLRNLLMQAILSDVIWPVSNYQTD